MDEEDDTSLFGEDVSFSQEKVERLLGKHQRKPRPSTGYANRRQKREMNSAGKAGFGSDSIPEIGQGKGNKCSKLSKNKTKKPKHSSFIENEQKNDNYTGSPLGRVGNNLLNGGETVSEIITVEENEKEETKVENQVIRINVKVYKRRESEICILKKLVVAVYVDDPIRKLLVYISKNLTPKPANLEEIRIYFDGDSVRQEMLVKEIGIENEEQLEIKVPFESIWS